MGERDQPLTNSADCGRSRGAPYQELRRPGRDWSCGRRLLRVAAASLSLASAFQGKKAISVISGILAADWDGGDDGAVLLYGLLFRSVETGFYGRAASSGQRVGSPHSRLMLRGLHLGVSNRSLTKIWRMARFGNGFGVMHRLIGLAAWKPSRRGRTISLLGSINMEHYAGAACASRFVAPPLPPARPGDAHHPTAGMRFRELIAGYTLKYLVYPSVLFLELGGLGPEHMFLPLCWLSGHFSVQIC